MHRLRPSLSSTSCLVVLLSVKLAMEFFASSWSQELKEQKFPSPARLEARELKRRSFRMAT